MRYIIQCSLPEHREGQSINKLLGHVAREGRLSKKTAHIIYIRHLQKNNYSEEWKEEVRLKEVRI